MRTKSSAGAGTAILAGALLLKTSLIRPLIAVSDLALLTWMVYVPAARRLTA